MATALLWALAAILVLLVAAISLPLRLRLLARSAPVPRVEFRVQPFAGLFPSIRVIDSDRRSRAKKPARTKRTDERKRPKPKRRRRPEKRTVASKLARLEGLPTLLTDLLRAFRIRHVRAVGEIGFDDPADTGAAFGMLASVMYAIPSSPRMRLDVQPVFGEARLAGRIDAAVEVRPAALMTPAVRYLWRRFGRREA